MYDIRNAHDTNTLDRAIKTKSEHADRLEVAFELTVFVRLFHTC